MTDPARAAAERRVLVLAPAGRDAALARDVFTRAGIVAHACPTLPALCAELDAGAGALLIAEEAAGADRADELTGWLARQPPWSDLPVLLLARPGADSAAVARAVELLGNVTVLERPARIASLVSAARTALRGRDRQYQARQHLLDREQTAAELRTLMDLLPVGVFIAHDPASLRITGNRAANAILRMPSTSNLSVTAPPLERPTHFHPSRDGVVIPPAELPVQRAAHGEDVRNEEIDQVFDDGTVVHTLVSASPLFDAAGRPRGAVASITDITAQKRAEEAVRASEARFRTFADTAPAMLWVTEPDGSCSFLSRGWYDFTGQAEGAGLGFGWLDAVHPADRPAAGAAFLAANARRAEFALEHRLRRADGEYRWVMDAGRPRTGPAGEALGYIGSVIDITDRKRAEEQLRRSHDTFFTLIENAPFGVYVVDADFRLRQVSAGAQAVFANVRPLLGRDFAEVIHAIWPEPFATAVIERFRHTLATGEPYAAPDTTERRGDVAAVESYDWKIERVTLPAGSFGVVCYFYDITDRKAAEAALRAAADRQAYLVRLADTLRPLSDPAAAQAAASRALGEHLGVSRVLYFEIAADEYVVERDYCRGVESIAGRYPVGAFGPTLLANFLAGRMVVETDATTHPGRPPAERAAFAAIQVHGHVDVPLVKNGAFVAGMTVQCREPREWTADEVAVIEETAERTWATVERAKAEAARRASEERFRAAVGATSDLVWTNDAAGRMSGEQPGWGGFTGQAFDEYQGYGWSAAIHPDDARPTIDAWERAVAERRRFEFDHRVRRRDGAYRRCTVRAVPVLDPGGAVREWVGVHTDVTDQRAAVDALRASEGRFRFLDAVGEATRATDDPGAVMAAAARVLGEHLAVTRCAYADVDADGDRFTIRDDWRLPGVSTTAGVYSLDLFGPRAAADMRAGRVLVVRDVDAELAPAAGADTFNAIGIKAIVTCPLVKDGRLRAMMAVHSAAPRDWTADEVALVREAAERAWAHIERVRAAADARASEARRRLALDGAELGAWNIDPQTNTLTTDERFQLIFRGAARPVTYEEAFAVIHPDDRELVRDRVAAATRPVDPEPYTAEYRVVHPDGAVRWVYAKGRATFDGDGPGRRPTSFDGTVMDVTDRKQMEDDLRRAVADLSDADRRKNEFLAMLAHELRNPLAPIRNSLHILRLVGGGAEAAGVHDMMDRQVNHMVRLVDDLLEVSRITRGKIDLRRARVEVAAVLRTAVETSRPLIDAAQHTLTVDVPAEPLAVDGDAVRLAQVFANLLNNAAKYTDPGGAVHVRARADGADAVVTVRDTGAGIPAEMLGRVFELFTQIDRSDARAQGGLGIGLTLVKSLVELHGGRVAVRSDGPGTGSEFEVRLPRANG